MDALDQMLKKTGGGGFVAFGSSQDANVRYLTQFTSSDPVVYFRRRGEKGTLIVSQMEARRAAQESSASVMTRAEAGLLDIVREEKDRVKALAMMITRLIDGEIFVPANFPFLLAKEMEQFRHVRADRGTVETMRAVKTTSEVGNIETVQQATESAMNKALDLISGAKIRKDMLYRGAAPLTSEFVRESMQRVLVGADCHAMETIVSCGEESAVPHITGSGPLHAHQPIVIDIFPRSERTGYYTDMTRTVCRGEASPEIREMYRAVKGAQAHAAERIRPGATGEEVHQSAVEFFKECGYESGDRGFIHNLGHGVGLEVHELPSIGPGGETIRAGNVVTNEPGLYYPGLGGVRLENIGVVTRDGWRCITAFPETLEI
ncbi:Xaa-Pro aminopeptidase [Methanolinea mesophila]|uniref:M24 family metallopeptidase n=1 Tax=Methanolinea mesophila TaxID=547055 RepID=UPI001AEA26E8|nr:Xaa-Pro peptidase family protein [Methanolinea mesophila]MBP1928578.1 Xaa-Pro aminopeptidase [Methanolinea mesophila]